LGEQKVTGLKLKDLKTGAFSELPIDGMFLAIGQIPSTDFLKGSGVELDKWGFVTFKENTMTSVSGVFAAGDCSDFRYRQGIVAAGSGARAAIDAKLWLEKKD
jgi:thioredoxin reductase (NADPH)